MTRSGLGVKVLVATAVTAFIAWRLYATASRRPGTVLVLLDASGSQRGDSCNDAAGMAAEALAEAEFIVERVILMGSGDEGRANEPEFLADIEVPQGERTTQLALNVAQRRTLVGERLRDACLKSGRRLQSPMTLAVARAIEQLRAVGCLPTGRCALLVRTDGQVNGDVPFERALATGETQEIAPLDNSGISVHLCGFGDTVGKVGKNVITPPRDRAAAERLRLAWASLFREPMASWAPFCPRLPEEVNGLATKAEGGIVGSAP